MINTPVLEERVKQGSPHPVLLIVPSKATISLLSLSPLPGAHTRFEVILTCFIKMLLPPRVTHGRISDIRTWLLTQAAVAVIT